MSLFQCARCGCRENTALSHQGFIFDSYFDWTDIEEYRGKKLCSACGPFTYKDSGKILSTRMDRELPGVWHGQFERSYLPKDGSIFTNRVGNLESKDGRPLSELYSPTEYPPVRGVRFVPEHVVNQVSALVLSSRLDAYLAAIDSSFSTETRLVDIVKCVDQVRLSSTPNKHAKNRLPRGKSRRTKTVNRITSK